MRIERIETYPLLYKLPKPYGDANGYKKYRSCFLIRIITSSGIDGWGECIDWLPTLVKGFKERIIPYLIGKEATNRLQIVQVIKNWHRRIAAGISMALTEVLAKAANLHVTDLWGGRWRESVPVYASFQSYLDDPNWVSHSLAMVKNAIDAQFSDVKVKVGGRTFLEDRNHIELLQQTYGNQMRIALDGNQSYDFATALKWTSFIQRWENWLWFEEPMPIDRVLEYKRLRLRMPIPLAGGENLKETAQFLPLLNEGAIDILQPDVNHIDGIDAFREILNLTRHFGIRGSSHSFDGSLSRLYAIFAHLCLPPWSKMKGDDIEPVEWDMMENPFSKLVPIQPVNGQVTIVLGKGLGVDLDQELIAFYRWDGTNYIE